MVKHCTLAGQKNSYTLQKNRVPLRYSSTGAAYHGGSPPETTGIFLDLLNQEGHFLQCLY
jgi:hypothetical protein